MAKHDILKGSAAWDRLRDGVPADISTPPSLRRLLHDYANVITVMVNDLNELYDSLDEAYANIENAQDLAKEAVKVALIQSTSEHTRLDSRIDKRTDEHKSLSHRLLDGEDGIIPKKASKKDVSRLTAMLWGILISVTTAALLLALNLVAAEGGPS